MWYLSNFPKPNERKEGNQNKMLPPLFIDVVAAACFLFTLQFAAASRDIIYVFGMHDCFGRETARTEKSEYFSTCQVVFCPLSPCNQSNASRDIIRMSHCCVTLVSTPPPPPPPPRPDMERKKISAHFCQCLILS